MAAKTNEAGNNFSQVEPLNFSQPVSDGRLAGWLAGWLTSLVRPANLNGEAGFAAPSAARDPRLPQAGSGPSGTING